jgi:AcrR family transcriptional regulator
MSAVRRADQLRPRKRPVQARSQRTVDAILKAAAQVFARRGYAGATTNHIAERAGVSVGSLYEYFPSKDALLVALMEVHLAEGETVLQKAVVELGASGARALAASVRHVARATVQLHARDRELHRILFEEAPLPRRIRRLLVEIEARATERVGALLRTHPEVSVPNPALAAAIVVHTVEALTHRLVIHGGADVDLEAYVEEIVRLVVRYLTTEEHSARPLL